MQPGSRVQPSDNETSLILHGPSLCRLHQVSQFSVRAYTPGLLREHVCGVNLQQLLAEACHVRKVPLAKGALNVAGNHTSLQ